jgi:predicted alpha-1,2-mannosidase
MYKQWIQRLWPVVSALLLAAAGAPLAHAHLTQFVDPMIGTGPSNSPNPVPGGAGGSTIPGAMAPFGMVQFSPDTNSASPSGYGFNGTEIQEFSMTHFNGAGCPNKEDIQILPITGAIGASPGTSWGSYASNFSHATEDAMPGYYRVTLSEFGGIMVELTASKRTGMARLTFPATTQARLLINPSRNATNGTRSGSVTINGNTVTGQATGGNFCGTSRTYPIFFAMQFDRAPTGFGTWTGGTVSNGSASANGTSAGGFVTFDTSSNRMVHVKIAISSVSIANAQLNLSTESPGFNFDGIRAATDSAWDNVLHRIDVQGGTTTDRTKFYTALYHVFSNPNIYSDVDGRYRGFDNVIRSAGGRVNYQNYSGWDIIRSWSHLVGAIAPEGSDIAHSMVQAGVESGLLPFWTDNNVEAHVMVGDPGTINVANLYAMGVRNFDTAMALSLMDKSGNNTASTQRSGLSNWINLHWNPGNAAVTLEYAAADFALSQYAQALGNTTLVDRYAPRAQYWKNNWNPATGYVQPRNANGTWACEPFNPAAGCGYIEGNGAQYVWMVPFNLRALANLMGGNANAVSRLDNMFTELNAGTNRPFFYIGNEPQHNAPWTYNFVQQPWKTQNVVRRVINESFTAAAGGLPGNDDLGATSAWLVWSYLGLYPMIPGRDELVFNGPLFPSATVRLANGNTLQINATNAGQGNQYIQNLTVNGVSTTKSWLRFADIAGGATLNFTMGSSPNMAWGSAAADVPPSFDVGAPPAGNLALNRPATGSTACNTNEAPPKAVNGSVAGGNSDKFCSLIAGTKFLQVDLGSNRSVNRFIVRHAGAGGESATFNTSAFNIQVSTDAANWTTVATVTGNTANVTTHNISAVTARHIRLNIVTGAQAGSANTARIYEFEAYGP